MAAIVQQQPAARSEESAARQFWREKMDEHPTIAGLLAIAGEVAGFFLNGHFIVALARWIIRVSGYVAESALLFAVLWISGTSVAPHLVVLVMSAKTMQSLVSVALVVLALIPEVILANAIINALGHVSTAAQNKMVVSWVWAALFLIPTILFLFLTAYTLGTLAANGGNFVQASTGMVGLRSFAGWSYGLLEMVYAGVGRRMVNQVQPMMTPTRSAPAAQIDYEEIARQLIPLVAQEVRQAVSDTTDMREQLQQLRVHLEDVTALFLSPSAPKSETGQSTSGNSAKDRSFHAWETDEEPNVDRQEQQPVSAMSTPPRAKITRKLSAPASTKRATPRRKRYRHDHTIRPPESAA